MLAFAFQKPQNLYLCFYSVDLRLLIFLSMSQTPAVALMSSVWQIIWMRRSSLPSKADPPLLQIYPNKDGGFLSLTCGPALHALPARLKVNAPPPPQNVDKCYINQTDQMSSCYVCVQPSYNLKPFQNQYLNPLCSKILSDLDEFQIFLL